MDRISEIRSALGRLNLDAFLVKNLLNIRYLSGFSGSAGSLLITRGKSYFISDFRYKTQSKAEVKKDFEIIIYKQGSLDFLGGLMKQDALKRIGFESNFLTYSEAEYLKQNFKEAEFVPVERLIENIVIRKTEEEISYLQKAVDITDEAFTKILGVIKPGMTENDVAAELTYIQRKLGAEKDSFDSIVASGERSAFPHARPTDRVIQNGDLITLDFGSTYKGFNSDMTRTIAVGNIPDEAKKIYNIVKEAQQRALDGVKAGVIGKELDSCARDFIKDKGYGDNFGHGLGHGLGYAVHEDPRVNQYSEYKLEENNVITIEPGVYVEGFGGVRIEDDVVVTKEGCTILNRSSKELIVL